MRFSISAAVLGAAAAALAAVMGELPLPDGTSGPGPRTIHRLPDSHWDHIVSGQQVEQDGRRGGPFKRYGGQLANYNLRVRAVDPSSLGIDIVKQYSGYLDDLKADKHLFFCECGSAGPTTPAGEKKRPLLCD